MKMKTLTCGERIMINNEPQIAGRLGNKKANTVGVFL